MVRKKVKQRPTLEPARVSGEFDSKATEFLVPRVKADKEKKPDKSAKKSDVRKFPAAVPVHDADDNCIGVAVGFRFAIWSEPAFEDGSGGMRNYSTILLVMNGLKEEINIGAERGTNKLMKMIDNANGWHKVDGKRTRGEPKIVWDGSTAPYAGQWGFSVDQCAQKGPTFS